MNVEVATKWEALFDFTNKWDELANEDLLDGFFRESGWYQSYLFSLMSLSSRFCLPPVTVSNNTTTGGSGRNVR